MCLRVVERRKEESRSCEIWEVESRRSRYLSLRVKKTLQTNVRDILEIDCIASQSLPDHIPQFSLLSSSTRSKQPFDLLHLLDVQPPKDLVWIHRSPLPILARHASRSQGQVLQLRIAPPTSGSGHCAGSMMMLRISLVPLVSEGVDRLAGRLASGWTTRTSEILAHAQR